MEVFQKETFYQIQFTIPKLVTRLINKIMLDGKKGTAQTILYHAFERVEAKTGKPAMEVFEVSFRQHHA